MLQQLVNGISLGTIYAVVAVGFSLIFSILRLVNFAHGGMLLIGAYGGYYLLRARMPSLPAFAMSCVGAGLVAILMEKVILKPIRRRGRPLVYFFMASMTVFTLMENFLSAATGANVMSFPKMMANRMVELAGTRVSLLDFVILLITASVLLVTTFILYRTNIGLAIRAAAQDPYSAGLCGIDMDRVISVAFFMSGVLGGIGGFLLGMNYTVNPELGRLVYKAFAACMIGGLGSLSGAVLGALLLGLLETLLVAYVSSSLAPTLSYVTVIVFLLLKPSGLMGVFVEKL